MADPAQAAQASLPLAPQAPQNQRAAPDPIMRIQALIDAERAPAPQTQAAAPQLGDAPQQDAQPAADAEAPAGPNKQQEGDSPEAAEGDPAGGDSNPQPLEIPLDQLEAVELEVTIKGDEGKDVVEKLPVKELKLGYMRQKDYQRKTAEVARQREAVAEEVTKGVTAERTKYAQDLGQLQEMVVELVAPDLKNVDWDNLATNDPFEYTRLQHRANKVSQALSAIQARRTDATTKQQAEQKQALQNQALKARETLENDIPGWDDALYQTLMKSGSNVGYKPEEVATWVDPRAIKLLHKAHLYDQLKAGEKAPSADKRVVTVPKAIKPGPTQQTSQRQQQEQGAMKRLQGSGKIEDAAAVIRSRLG